VDQVLGYLPCPRWEVGVWRVVGAVFKGFPFDRFEDTSAIFAHGHGGDGMKGAIAEAGAVIGEDLDRLIGEAGGLQAAGEVVDGAGTGLGSKGLAGGLPEGALFGTERSAGNESEVEAEHGGIIRLRRCVA